MKAEKEKLEQLFSKAIFSPVPKARIEKSFSRKERSSKSNHKDARKR